MKTRELIAALQEQDPSGEIEVCVENADIHVVTVEPAYLDGCLQVLKRDPAKADSYNITGVEFVSGGAKVVIVPLSAQWALRNDPEMPVTFDSDAARERYAERVAKWRADARAVNRRTD
jgi:hypothetical protein